MANGPVYITSRTPELGPHPHTYMYMYKDR